jgi:hypothetical protein
MSTPPTPERAPQWAVRIQGRIAELEWLKTPEPDDIEQAARALIGHTDYRPGLALLVIDRGTDFNPTQEMIEHIVGRLAPDAKHDDLHIAIVVEKESHFGLARRFASCAEKHGMVLMPFRHAATARQWLLAYFSDSQFVAVPAE